MSERPPAHIGCFQCGVKWEPGMAFGIVVKDDHAVQPLSEFIGKSLTEVASTFSAKTDAKWVLGHDLVVRNDKNIDLSSDPKYPSLKVNEHGWLRGIPRSYVVQPGDEGFFYVTKYLHFECNHAYLERIYVEHYGEIFKAAGLEATLTPVPNGYCSCDSCGPWVKAATPIGEIEMGWRKRVINIDWSATGFGGTNLFEDEQVTKGVYHIHAWGKAKAVDYLKRLKVALTT